MKGKIIADWSKVDLTRAGDPRKVFGAMQHFCNQLSESNLESVYAALQHFTTKGDFPTEVNAILEKFRVLKTFDEGWRQIFDVRDYTGTKESGFDLLDVQDGITFRVIPTGDKIILHKFSGSKVSVSFQRYGGGVGFDRTWFEDSKFWDVEDTLIAFRNKAFFIRADVFYSLIEAVSSDQNLDWQNPEPSSLASTDPNYTAIRDIQTINKACENIVTDLKDSSLDAGVDSTFILSAPIQLWSRMRRALGLLNAGLSGSQSGVNWNVQLVMTQHYSTTTKYYICLPGQKNKAGIRQELSLFGAFDNLAYVDNIAGWQRFGGAIGETNQFQRCSTS